MKKIVLLVLCFSLAAQGNLFQPKHEERPETGQSVAKAALMSLVLPGSGELYLGQNGRSYAFFAVEGAVWLTYAGFLTQSRMLEDEYKAYGASKAGMNPTGKKSDFFELLGQYDSRYEYNLYTALGQRSYANIYPETPDYFWEWETKDDRYHYDDLRVRSDRAMRNSTIVLAAAGINRLISVIDVIRIGTYGVKKNKDFAISFNARPMGENLDMKIVLSRSF